ncbi:MAG: N4-gp56 family major capsid protein [Caulobacteraceae bacterium]|nr:N4-gp56 family major capsid protein [Caulobacteraceae bacterium]
MAAPYTDSATLTALVTAAYDRQVRLSLRSVPMFRSVATVKVVDQTHPGSSVAFLIHGDLSPATATLSDNMSTASTNGTSINAPTNDPTGAVLSNPTSVTVTLNEYGNFTVVTKALREFALDNNLDGNIANVIAYNLANSVDIVIRNILVGTDNNITSQVVTSNSNYIKPVKRSYSELLRLGTGTSVSSSTTTITVASTVNLKVGMTFSVVAGTGVLAAGAAGNTIATIASGTTFTVTTAPTTALSGATLAFDTNYFLEASGASTAGSLSSLGTLTAKDVRWVVAQLRANNVQTVDGQNYVAFIHPTVAADFRAETSSSGASAIWAAPHTYSETSNMYAGEIGTFEGVRFIETPRVPAIGNTIVAVKNGTAQNSITANAYTTFVMGADALAEAVAEEFHIVADGTIVDPLKRRMALGWYGVAGWNLFRAEALYAIKSTTNNG